MATPTAPPEGPLVAIFSIRTDAPHNGWLQVDSGYALLGLPAPLLASLQLTVRSILLLTTDDRTAVHTADTLDTMQQAIFFILDCAIRNGHMLHDDVDLRLSQSPMIDFTCEALANQAGVSVRTLPTAVYQVCGPGLHRYSRLRQLCSVRRQLRMAFPGQVKRAGAWLPAHERIFQCLQVGIRGAAVGNAQQSPYIFKRASLQFS